MIPSFGEHFLIVSSPLVVELRMFAYSGGSGTNIILGSGTGYDGPVLELKKIK